MYTQSEGSARGMLMPLDDVVAPFQLLLREVFRARVDLLVLQLLGERMHAAAGLVGLRPHGRTFAAAERLELLLYIGLRAARPAPSSLAGPAPVGV